MQHKSSTTIYYCVECRIAQKSAGWDEATETVICSRRHPMKMAGSRWRAPKKNNHKAWKQIAAGDIWWDKSAIDKKNHKQYLWWEKSLANSRRRKRALDKQ